jgi:predicted MPP superfamily phosphohydrolase
MSVYTNRPPNELTNDEMEAKSGDFDTLKIEKILFNNETAKFFKVARDEKKIEHLLQQNNDKNKATIFISHQPKDYKLAVKTNTALFLCGHTHGGQIFPFHFLVKLVQPFLAGVFYKKQTAIYVNKGLGTWGIHYRYKANSEITILKLIAKSVKYPKGMK